MRLERTERFLRDYRELPASVRRQTDRKLLYLAESIGHPSLRVKHVHGREGVFEGSISMSYRFLFRISDDGYVLLKVRDWLAEAYRRVCMARDDERAVL